jgi:hypothetical protein
LTAILRIFAAEKSGAYTLLYWQPIPYYILIPIHYYIMKRTLTAILVMVCALALHARIQRDGRTEGHPIAKPYRPQNRLSGEQGSKM